MLLEASTPDRVDNSRISQVSCTASYMVLKNWGLRMTLLSGLFSKYLLWNCFLVNCLGYWPLSYFHAHKPHTFMFLSTSRNWRLYCVCPYSSLSRQVQWERAGRERVGGVVASWKLFMQPPEMVDYKLAPAAPRVRQCRPGGAGSWSVDYICNLIHTCYLYHHSNHLFSRHTM